MSSSRRHALALTLPALVSTCLGLGACSSLSPAPGADPPADSARDAASGPRGVVERRLERLESEGPKSFDAPAEAAEFFLDQRVAPGTTRLPLDHLWREEQDLSAREAQLAQSARAWGGVLGWQHLGPGNIGGRTRALVIDPNRPDTMYAAGVAGGVWKSSDAGASWLPADDFMLNLAVTSLAMDPFDSNVLYAGTGEGFYYSNVFVQGLGIFKSVDAGATWTHLPGTTSGVPPGAFDYVNKVVVSPNDPFRVYAATRTGVWRSSNGGQTWQAVLTNPTYLAGPAQSAGCLVGCTELVARDDRDPDVLFACFGSGQKDGLYRSFDGGDSWQAYLVPDNQGRMTLALHAADQDVMYLLMADNGVGGALGQLVNVYRSLDGGDSFEGRVDFQSKTGPWLLSNLVLATGCVPDSQTYSQGWYDSVIAVDPLDPNQVWVGGVDLFRSDDGGANFGLAGYWFYYAEPEPPPSYIHPDHHEIVFHPDFDGLFNQTMFVTCDGGIYRTENAWAGTTQEDCPFPPDEPLPEIEWEDLNNGYGVTQYYHGDSGRGVDLFVGGAQDNGTNRVTSSSTPNDWDLIFGGDGGYVAIDPTNSQTMYIEYHEFPSIHKSTDGGDTFSEATSGITDTDGLFITPFAMDPSDADVLWTGGRRPWRTLDGASSWHLAGPNFASADRISAVAVAPSNGDVVYLGFNNGYVARSTNALSPSPTWTVLGNGLQAGWVSSLAVDPADPSTVYCTYSNYGLGHVLRSANGGASWTTIDGTGASVIPDIPAHWIAVRPCNSRELYVGTELGLFQTSDGGTTWEPANSGLAHTVVESLDFQDADTLVAFTHGRGVYRTSLAPCPGTYRDVDPSAAPGP